MKRQITSSEFASSCYFRSSVEPPYRKALLQITERCNLACAHCFVSAGDFGDTMSLADIEAIVIPRFRECRVISVSLTGGEPFVHPQIVEIATLIRKAGMSVTICTNATHISQSHIEGLAQLGGVRCNVSLDGFAPESHGRFRGNKESFAITIETIRRLSRHKLLQGLLVTPNSLAEAEEYVRLCEFAVEQGATYVLMNPLSSMGRGVKSMSRLAMPDDIMRSIVADTKHFADDVQLVYIRFPNDAKLPLASCEAGNIVYVFTHGELAICPYLVFAANTPQSLHRPEEFIVGNILRDQNIATMLDNYNFRARYQAGGNTTCRSCDIGEVCGKGCPAAVISAGKRMGEVDAEICPRSIV